MASVQNSKIKPNICKSHFLLSPSSILLSQMSKLQTKEFTWQTQASSPLVPLQFDSAQYKRTEKYPSMQRRNKNPTHYAHISPVLWKHWRHSVFQNAVKVHSSSKPNHKARTASVASAIKWKNKRFTCTLLPYSLSPSPFCPFILCQCVAAIVLTLVIDHNSGSAPTSLPSLETPLWNDNIGSHCGTCQWDTEHLCRPDRVNNKSFSRSVHTCLPVYGNTEWNKGYDVIQKDSRSSPPDILIVLSFHWTRSS